MRIDPLPRRDRAGIARAGAQEIQEDQKSCDQDCDRYPELNIAQYETQPAN
jgi:hypothetical protein